MKHMSLIKTGAIRGAHLIFLLSSQSWWPSHHDTHQQDEERKERLVEIDFERGLTWNW